MVTTAEKLLQLAEAPTPAHTGPVWGVSVGAWGLEPNGVQVNLQPIFRRSVDAPALAEEPDAGDLLERCRVQTSHIVPAEYAALTGEHARLTELLAVAAKKAAEVEAALDDPQLVTASDFSQKVAQLHSERDILQARRGEAEAALGVCNSKTRQLRDATFKAMALTVGLTARLEREELEERGRRIIGRIAEAVSPLLDELLAVKRAAARPQDLEAVAAELAEERFSTNPKA